MVYMYFQLEFYYFLFYFTALDIYSNFIVVFTTNSDNRLLIVL
jgi:hypothetical protein